MKPDSHGAPTAQLPLATRRELLASGASLATASALSSLVDPEVGQPLRREPPPRRVVIIGAGLAGLSAAYDLKNAGHVVTVLEARMRPGGRVLTLREPFSDGLYAEAGALFIPDNHDLTQRYIREFSLPTTQVEARGATEQYYIRGSLHLVRGQGRAEWGLDLTPDEQRLGVNGLWDRYIIPSLREVGDPLAAGWPPESIKRLDDISMAGFLKARGASPGAIYLLRQGYLDLWGEGLETFSALSLLRDLTLRAGERHSVAIRGGNDQLPKAFASRLREQIRYGAAVTRIEREPSIRVRYRQGGEDRVAEADHVICANPFTTLRRIEVTPAFSPRKRAMIEGMAYTSVTRVFLQCKRKFWQDRGLQGATTTDLPVQWLWEPTVMQSGTRGILESYMAGANARKAAALPEPERIRTVAAQMEKVFAGLRDNLEGGASKAWDEDEWSRGDYAWFKPGQLSGDLRGAEAPEGRIHFAGEHVSPWPGWMQGAIYAGLRAAREVNQAP